MSKTELTDTKLGADYDAALEQVQKIEEQLMMLALEPNKAKALGVSSNLVKKDAIPAASGLDEYDPTVNLA